MIKKILILFFSTFLFLYAETKNDKNIVKDTKNSSIENSLDIENMVEANILSEKIAKIELSLKDNILLKRYSNYLAYGKISAELDVLKENLKKLIQNIQEN